MEYFKTSGIILDACITVHKIMGPGLLESIYEQCLMKEFELRMVKARNQVPVSLIYKANPCLPSGRSAPLRLCGKSLYHCSTSK